MYFPESVTKEPKTGKTKYSMRPTKLKQKSSYKKQEKIIVSPKIFQAVPEERLEILKLIT